MPFLASLRASASATNPNAPRSLVQRLREATTVLDIAPIAPAAPATPAPPPRPAAAAAPRTWHDMCTRLREWNHLPEPWNTLTPEQRNQSVTAEEALLAMQVGTYLEVVGCLEALDQLAELAMSPLTIGAASVVHCQCLSILLRC